MLHMQQRMHHVATYCSGPTTAAATAPMLYIAELTGITPERFTQVPMTAILKICLEHMDHPFATAFAYLMDGKTVSR